MLKKLPYKNPHLYLIAFWVLMIPPTILIFKNSVLWIAFMSLYANIEASAAALAASRKPGQGK